MKNFVVNEAGPREVLPGNYSYHPLEGFRRDESAGGAGQVFDGIDFDALPPILRTLLVSDGTVTKFLEAYYWEPIEVKRLFHGDIVLEKDLADLGLTKGAHVLHRQVAMRGLFSGRIFGRAESYIRANQLWPGVEDDLIEGRLGVGELLRERRIETHRELLRYQTGPVGDLAVELGAQSDELMISRTYRIHIGRQPALLITDRYPVSHFA